MRFKEQRVGAEKKRMILKIMRSLWLSCISICCVRQKRSVLCPGGRQGVWSELKQSKVLIVQNKIGSFYLGLNLKLAITEKKLFPQTKQSRNAFMRPLGVSSLISRYQGKKPQRGVKSRIIYHIVPICISLNKTCILLNIGGLS